MTTEDQLIELVYGDTDSLYMSYEGLINTIEGVENMTLREKVEIIVRINQEFLNQHNKEFMEEYYAPRHSRDMVQEFELETVCKSGVWLNVKKRYAQVLAWQDGKYFDEDDMPVKAKGLEIVKSSYPSLGRKILKELMNHLINSEHTNGALCVHEMNIIAQQRKREWDAADIELICPTTSVNYYMKYIEDDTNPLGPVARKKAPFQVKGLAMYNCLRQGYNLPGDPLYGGKMRYYAIKGSNPKNVQFFCFQAGSYPKWAPQYAPIDRSVMYQRCVLDPINRVLEACGMPLLSLTGFIQPNLFG